MSVWLQITAGQGPAECQWVVARVAEKLEEECAAALLKSRRLEAAPGEQRGTAKSILMVIEGNGALQFAESWEGTVQWIGKSLYRPHHRRKNWYVGVDLVAVPESLAWSAEEVKIDVMRASGPGGQHVNKTSSAVRATHVPTGLVAIAQEERSQHQNRRLALARLAKLVDGQRQSAEAATGRERWEQHAALERGNPVRVYQGEKFVLQKRR